MTRTASSNEPHYQPEQINTACVARFSMAMIDHDSLRLIQELE